MTIDTLYIDYGPSTPTIVTITDEKREASLINGKWQLINGRVLERAADKTPNEVIIRLRRVDDIQIHKL